MNYFQTDGQEALYEQFKVETNTLNLKMLFWLFIPECLICNQI